ncbi:MAG: AAA family ATPase, partial [Myxococcota bacterium]
DDISMTQDYATLLGYTQQELETYFATHIKQLAAQLALSHQHCLDTIRLWYNGYRFSRKQVRVYNPFSTLLLLRHREFHPHWFATGTPTFLIELLKQRPDIKPQQLSNCQVDQEAFLSYNLEHIEESLLPLLVQTGYLTIDSCTTDPHTQETTYRLNYPNQEVRNAMLRQLLQSYSGAGAAEAGGTVRLLAQALRDNNLPTFFKHLRTLFACVPYDMHIAKESYYQSLFHLIHQLLGFPTAAQVHTNIGRIDSVVHTDKRIYIFEFKMGNVVTSDTTATVATQTDDQALATATVHDARGDSDSVFADEQQPPVGDVLALKALRQMKAKRYYEQYLAAGKEIVLVGAGFVWQWQDDSGKPARPVRQVTAWVSEVVAV